MVGYISLVFVPCQGETEINTFLSGFHRKELGYEPRSFSTRLLDASIYAIFIMLITLDTNVIYQALHSSSGASFYILQQVRERKIKLALSVPLIKEYEDVLKREKSLENFGLQLEDIDKFLHLIAYIGKPYEAV